MFAILRGANGRRHEVDFHDDPVAVAVAMSATTVQITMTTADCSDRSRGRYVTVTLPRDAMAAAAASYTGFWVTRDQAARFAVTSMTSIPSWNLTPPMTFGN